MINDEDFLTIQYNLEDFVIPSDEKEAYHEFPGGYSIETILTVELPEEEYEFITNTIEYTGEKVTVLKHHSDILAVYDDDLDMIYYM